MTSKRTDRKIQDQLIDEAFEQKIAKYNITAKKIMPIIVISIIVDMLGYIMVMPLLPFYAQSFGASDFTIGVIMSLNAVTSLITGPIWGRLSDKYGRKPILLLSQAGTLASFILLAISNSIWMLTLSRIIDGLFGGQIPVINATVIDVTAPETRAEKMAVLSISMTVGSIVGPMIGGYLGEINITYPAYAACIMSSIAIISTTIIFTETMPIERRQDLQNSMREQVNQVNQKVVTTTVLLRLAQIFAMTFIFSLIFSSMSFILTQKYGAGTVAIGNIITAMGICTFIYGGILLKRVRAAIGEQRLLLLAIILLIIAFAVMPNLPTLTSFYLFIIIFSAGSNFGRPILGANLSRAVDEDKQGLVSGYSTSVNSIARSIAPLISTGWLQLGGLTIGALFLNKYYLIAITGIITGLLFLGLYSVDQRADPQTRARTEL